MTETLKFDKGIAIPPKTRRPSAPRSDLLKMAVGDSFFEAEDDTTKLDAYSRLMHRGGYASRKTDGAMKFEVREVTENGVNGARIWRTA